MAFDSPSPGPGWTALTEPPDSSSEFDDADRREEIDFTPPVTQHAPTRKTKKKAALEGRVDARFKPPVSGGDGSVGALDGGVSSRVSKPALETAVAPIAQRTSAVALASMSANMSGVAGASREGEAERLRKLESAMSGHRNLAGQREIDDVQKLAADISLVESNATSSTVRGSLANDGQRSTNATSRPTGSTLPENFSNPNTQPSPSTRKAPTLLKPKSTVEARSRLLARLDSMDASPSTSERVAASKPSSQAVPKPTTNSVSINTVIPSASAFAGPSQIQENKEKEPIYISSGDESSKKVPESTNAGNIRVEKEGKATFSRGETSTVMASRSNLNGFQIPKKQKVPSRPVQTARKRTGVAIPLKRPTIPATETGGCVSNESNVNDRVLSDSDEFPSGLQLSQQVRKEMSMKDKGKGKSIPSDLESRSSARGRLASDRRRTIAADTVIDLTDEPEATLEHPSGRRRATIHLLSQQHDGTQNDPFELLDEDDGNESPPNVLPISGAFRKIKRAIKAPLKASLAGNVKPMERIHATSTIDQNTRGKSKAIVVDSISERSLSSNQGNDGCLKMDDEPAIGFHDEMNRNVPLFSNSRPSSPLPTPPPSSDQEPFESHELTLDDFVTHQASSEISVELAQVGASMVQPQISIPTDGTETPDVSSSTLLPSVAPTPSSIDEDAVEVDTMLTTSTGSRNSTSLVTPDVHQTGDNSSALRPDQNNETPKEERSTTSAFALEMDNLSLIKSNIAGGSTSKLPISQTKRASTTSDEPAVPRTNMPVFPKSAHAPSKFPNPSQSAAMSSTMTKPVDERANRPSLVDLRPETKHEAVHSSTAIVTPAAVEKLRNRSSSIQPDSKTRDVPSATPLKNIQTLREMGGKASDSSSSARCTSSALFQKSLSKLENVEDLVPAPRPSRSMRKASDVMLKSCSTQSKSTPGGQSVTEIVSKGKEYRDLPQVIQRNIDFNQVSMANVSLNRSLNSGSNSQQTTSMASGSKLAKSGTQDGSAPATMSVVENTLSKDLQTLDIVEHELDDKQERPLIGVRRVSSRLKRTRSKSTLGSEMSSDDTHKFHDVKSLRVSKRSRLSSVEVCNVQEYHKSTPFNPSLHRKTLSKSQQSSSSVCQSDDDFNAADPPSPPTSAEEHMESLDGETNGVADGGLSRPSLISPITNGARRVSTARKDTCAEKAPAPFYGPNYRQAKHLHFDLHNDINSYDDEQRARNGYLLKLVFEAQMFTNTAHDEPDAPRIQLQNDVDDDPTPPFEFFYTNLMWHDEDVPPPDYQGLKGCDCVGGCDPKSKTCACIQRQRLQFQSDEVQDQWLPDGFMYDERERLIQSSFPIIECNDVCRCSEDCMNRVVQRGRKCSVKLMKTRNKGWGVFAVKKIPERTFVGIYSGELLTDKEGERRGKYYNNIGRTYLFDIDCWHLGSNNMYTIDAFYAGNFTRFLNHSCDPTCAVSFVYHNDAGLNKPLFALFTKRDVEQDEELTFSYFGEDDEDSPDEKSPKRGKHVKREKVYQKCMCGSKNCRGRLFM